MKLNTRLIKYFAFGFLSAISIIGAIAFNVINKNEESVDVKPDGRLQYKWYTPQLPSSISFAGETVPLSRWEVKERLDREVLVNYYMHGSLLYILKLSSRYFP